MTAPFRLYGAELSPYSVKVRSYLRFKGVAFDWLERNQQRQEEFQLYAKLPLMPVLVDANEVAMQDSTPMIEALEQQFPDPSIVPDDPALAFLAALIEDYADEWLNKAMFHYRWAYPENRQSAAARLVAMLYEDAPAPKDAEEAVKTRMFARLHHVGSSPATAPLIEASFARLLAILQRLLGDRAYLFGARPCLADFGLAGQLSQLNADPSPGAMIKAQAPAVSAWLARMNNPRAEGDFLSFAGLRGGLTELLREEIAATYLVWMAANFFAVAEDSQGVGVDIAGVKFVQKPQRYAAKAYSELRRKRALLADNADLAALLGETGCDALLQPLDAGEESSFPGGDGAEED